MISPEIKDILDALAALATALGIPTAILVFYFEKRKELQQRENEAHAVSNERYIEYLSLCLQYPEADAFDLSRTDPDVIVSGLAYEELVLFTILISMLETAFLRYGQQRSKVRSTQWQGWVEYMQTWATRPNFARAWPLLRQQFDTGFVRLMDEITQKYPAALSEPTTAGSVARESSMSTRSSLE